MGIVKCWKTVDLDQINQHSLCWRVVQVDFGEIYPNLSSKAFHPKLTHFTPDPIPFNA